MQILQYFKGQVSFSVTSPPSEFQIVQNNLFTLTGVYAVHLTIYMFALIKEKDFYFLLRIIGIILLTLWPIEGVTQ